jgi:hypothetical protein
VGYEVYYSEDYSCDGFNTKAIYDLGTCSYWNNSTGKVTVIIDGTDVGGTHVFLVRSFRESEWRKFITPNVERHEITKCKPGLGCQFTVDLNR